MSSIRKPNPLARKQELTGDSRVRSFPCVSGTDGDSWSLSTSFILPRGAHKEWISRTYLSSRYISQVYFWGWEKIRILNCQDEEKYYRISGDEMAGNQVCCIGPSYLAGLDGQYGRVSFWSWHRSDLWFSHYEGISRSDVNCLTGDRTF